MQVLYLDVELTETPEQPRNAGLPAVGVEVENERMAILRQLERIAR